VTVITTDPARTALRFAALADYYQRAVLAAGGSFVCSCAMECRTSALHRTNTGFFEAQGEALGHHYDTYENGVPLRVLVVPMETGRTRRFVGLPERTEEVLVRIGTPWRSWNPHMRGVGLALRLAFGIDLDGDDEKLWLKTPRGRVHLLDAYGMCNLLLCSAVQLDTTTSRSTSVMRSNCSQHLAAAIRILQPTLVISQGATLTKPLSSLFGLHERLSPNLALAAMDSVSFVWADLWHPTYHWDWMARPYFHEVVIPTLTQAREVALARATTKDLNS